MAHAPAKHSVFEDAQGLLTGCLFVALAVCLFREASLFTGGTTGLAFLIHYVWGYSLGATLFVINLPFYIFGWHKLGRVFTVKTFAAVGLLAVYVELLPRWIGFEHLNPVFATVMAGLLAGTGILILIRHGASLGGVSIMAIYLQKSRGWRAGNVQMAIDAGILLFALWVTTPVQALLSLLGALALNLVISVNHRADRYYGV
ncbi:MAG: YitT family protein [Polaromonas sp.]|nr:YitT family protein [Polaromonas sp.]